MRFHTARELMAEVPAATPWLWDGYLARGEVTMLSGKPKVGKSSLVGELLAAVISGRDSFLGAQLVGGPAPVVLVTEESRRMVRQRLDGLPDGALDQLHVATREDLVERPAWPGLVRDAAGHARKQGSPLLVIDTLRGLADLHDNAEKDAGAMVRALRPLHAAASSHGLAVLVMHHDRKGGGAYGEATSGSNGIVGAVDYLLTMTRLDSGTRRRLDGIGRWEREPVVVDRGEDGYQLVGTAGRVRQADHVEAVRAVLMAGPRTLDQLVRDVNAESDGQLSRVRAHAMLLQLLDDGELVRDGKGVKGDPHRYSYSSTSLPVEGDETESAAAA